MAAPVPSSRITPTGKQMRDGFGAILVIESDRDIDFFEQELTPPGIQGDPFVEMTTNLNSLWRTKSPGELVEATDLTGVAGYDPQVWDQIVAIIQVPTTCTLIYPNGDKLAFFGYLMAWIPQALSKGTKPLANITVVVTNADPSTCVEQGPVFVSGGGTHPC